MTLPSNSPSTPINNIQRFEDFLRYFEEKPSIYKYQEEINNVSSKGGNTLIILFEDLLAFDSQIAERLRKDPEALIEDAVDAFKNVLKFQGGKITDQDYFVRISTKDEKSSLSLPLRGLRAKNIDNLILTKIPFDQIRLSIFFALNPLNGIVNGLFGSLVVILTKYS